VASLTSCPRTPRRSRFHGRFHVEAQLAEQPGKTNAGIALNGNLGPGARLFVVIGIGQPTLRQDGARLLAAIPCLTRQAEQPQVMLT
jgi:hypothetical protein